jgi:hypothetical protein
MRIRVTERIWVNGKDCNPGTVVEVEDGLGRYLIGMRRAEEHTGRAPAKPQLTEETAPAVVSTETPGANEAEPAETAEKFVEAETADEPANPRRRK